VVVAFGVGGEGVALVVGVSGVRVTLETLSWAAVMLWAPAGWTSTGGREAGGREAGGRGEGAGLAGRAVVAGKAGKD
jgi:hypothetical protein